MPLVPPPPQPKPSTSNRVATSSLETLESVPGFSESSEHGNQSPINFKKLFSPARKTTKPASESMPAILAFDQGLLASMERLSMRVLKVSEMGIRLIAQYQICNH